MSQPVNYFDSEEIFDFMYRLPDHSDLHLAHCGIQQCLPGHTFGPQARPEYHLHVILNGKGSYSVSNQEFTLSRGTMFLVPANVPVAYTASISDPWHYAWVAFSGRLAEELLHESGFEGQTYVRDSGVRPEEFADIIYEILKASKLTYSNELDRNGYLYDFFALLADTRPGASSQEKPMPLGDIHIEHALQYIHLAYHHDIKVQDIISYLGISRAYFAELFQRKMHMSPKDYLTLVRIRTAGRLLLETDLPVSQIGQRVGYRDPFIFSKAFHRTVGESPRAYRISGVNRL